MLLLLPGSTSVGMAAFHLITIEEYAWDDQANIGEHYCRYHPHLFIDLPCISHPSAGQTGRLLLVQRPEGGRCTIPCSIWPTHSVLHSRQVNQTGCCNSGSGWHIPGSDQLSRTRYSNQENISGVRILAVDDYDLFWFIILYKTKILRTLAG